MDRLLLQRNAPRWSALRARGRYSRVGASVENDAMRPKLILTRFIAVQFHDRHTGLAARLSHFPFAFERRRRPLEIFPRFDVALVEIALDN